MAPCACAEMGRYGAFARSLSGAGRASLKRGCCSSILPAKRRRISDSACHPSAYEGPKLARAMSNIGEDEASRKSRIMCSVVHQFSLVGGEDYESKEQRLQQLIERLPAGSGAAVVFAEPANVVAVEKVVHTLRRKSGVATRLLRKQSSLSALSDVSTDVSLGGALSDCSNSSASDGSDGRGIIVRPNKALSMQVRRDTSLPIVIVASADPTRREPFGDAGVQYVINFDLPTTGREYLRRLDVLSEVGTYNPLVAYTLVEYEQLKTRRCREIVGLLRFARKAAANDEQLGGVSKAIEFDSAMQQLEPESSNEEEEEDEGEGDEEGGEEEDEGDCDCPHCKSGSLGGITFFSPPPALGGAVRQAPTVEVVRVPLRALDDLSAAAALIAPRSPGHACTVVCLHNLFVHTPWDGWEPLFALPTGLGTVRVVLVLAEGGSWHDYPDNGAFEAGVAWMDILDMATMDRTDRLLEKLIDHEVELLGGRSERLVLMGSSQGGGQSMLRFLRSRHTLGGWVGTVCHVPTAPHVPRDRDPLLDPWRPPVNGDRPVRLLAGEADTVFTPGLVLRDAARLRSVGGFTDVEVEVRPGLTHEGFMPTSGPLAKRGKKEKAPDTTPDTAQKQFLQKAEEEVPELLFLRKYLPSMVGLVQA